MEFRLVYSNIKPVLFKIWMTKYLCEYITKKLCKCQEGVVEEVKPKKST